MPYRDSARGVIQDVLADDNEPADYPKQILDIVNAIEPHLLLQALNTSTADATLAPIVNGMVLITTQAPFEVYSRLGGVWKKIYPTLYNGTTVPANTLGIDGDAYFQTA